ncbi:cupin domain-containing protein [Paracoccidioides lutzii Pb01]|uniref:Cupin domain-containing protein n=1 Tax=Paracoccidioides lutzii (strain ATCC MYA-826 / Pb01) TaxID=502779 RepID=C1GVZ7_PARBA|nr:cupin domain-containing protein [Paracoccidioides lutzii Pb01]EEH40716.1 cupin domain-containing protein [Paracoccidioides lutzii Pb01]
MAAAEPTYDRTRPLPTVQPLYHHKLVNCPGMSIIGVLVKFPPNGASPPHRHGGASVSAYLLQGTLHNKMNDDPMYTVQQGGTWLEKPGCHHKISANVSATEPATILATFVIETEKMERDGHTILVQVDEEYRDLVFPEPEGNML